MLIYYPNTFLTNFSFRLCLRNSWSATVVFESSCRYTTVDNRNQDDFVKLFGIRKSPWPTNTRVNGAYLAWCYVPEGDKIRAAWYLHDRNGSFKFMTKTDAPLFDIGKPVSLSLINHDESFDFQLGDVKAEIEKAKYGIDNFKQGWSLQPWGGGTETIGHTRRVQLN